MRRSASDPDVWEIYVLARNYGAEPHQVSIALEFGTPGRAGRVGAGTRTLILPPGGEREATFEYRTAAAGILGVSLSPQDAFAADDRAEIELPALPALNVTVYSNEPDLLKPEFAATPRVHATYRKLDQYRPDDGGLVILDRFIPPQRPAADSIWIDPPSQGSPVPMRKAVQQVAFQGWDAGQPASAGLRTKDFNLERANVFEPAAGDQRIGEVEAGPVILARPGNPKMVVFGFHPALSAMRYELATPILFANLLRWFSPEIFRKSEISGGSVGPIKQVMEGESPADAVTVTNGAGERLPFTLRDHALSFFSGNPGSVRVVAGDREYLFSLTLPQLWDTKWEPPPDVPRGIPRFARLASSPGDVWQWLALLGALGLVVEWLLYGRFRRSRSPRTISMQRSNAVRPQEVSR